MKKEIINYCWKCGTLIKPKNIDRYFDINTGEERFNLLWVCPNKKWYNDHAKFKSDDNGSTYAFEA